MSVYNTTPADVAPECEHVRNGQLTAWATVTVGIPDAAGPPHGGSTYQRTVCPYCAGVAMGVWTGPLRSEG